MGLLVLVSPQLKSLLKYDYRLAMIKRNVEIVAQVFRKFTAAVDGFESYWRTRNYKEVL